MQSKGFTVLEPDSKPCPVCGETIKSVALKCRFCNTDLRAFAQTMELEVEKDVFSGHPAVFYSAFQLLPFLAAAAAAIAVALSAQSLAGFSWSLLGFVVLSGIIAAALYFRSRGIRYQITTQRIKLERGLLSKVQENLELFRIDHFEIRKPLGMRLLNQCSLHLFSSDAELTNFSVYGVPRLEAIAEDLREYQLRERKRRGLATFLRA